jgi:hypothetical protein
MNIVNIKNPPLLNGVNMNRQNPLTFEIPSKDERWTRREGDCVKVCVKGERFWVEITKINTDFDVIIYTGRIDNDLIQSESHNLYFNDVIQFCPDNILSVDYSNKKERVA